MRTAREHLFVAMDGDLFDTRVPNWARHPLRRNYVRAHSEIDTVAQLKATLRYGPYDWPGGYEIFFICDDGGVLCHKCARAEFRQIAYSVAHKLHDGWRVIACDNVSNVDTTDDEEPPFACEHCNQPIGGSHDA